MLMLLILSCSHKPQNSNKEYEKFFCELEEVEFALDASFDKYTLYESFKKSEHKIDVISMSFKPGSKNYKIKRTYLEGDFLITEISKTDRGNKLESNKEKIDFDQEKIFKLIDSISRKSFMSFCNNRVTSSVSESYFIKKNGKELFKCQLTSGRIEFLTQKSKTKIKDGIDILKAFGYDL